VSLRDQAGATGAPSSSDAYAASVAFFEHSLDAVLFTAPDGRVLDANAAATRLLRMSRDEICRRGRAGLADPSDARWVAGVEERKRTGRFVGSLSMLRGDATSVEVDLSSAVFANDDGALRTVVVFREAPKRATPADDIALIDPSGVSNRPAFIHLAEQQFRRAARDHLVVGLVFVRADHSDGTAPGTREASRRAIAASLSAECRLGDVVGRVGRDDFAVIVGEHDMDALSANLRLISTRVHAYDRRSSTPYSAHVGFATIDPSRGERLTAILADAAQKMDEHEEQQRASAAAGAHPCLFAIDDPSHVLPVEIDVTVPNVVLSKRELTVIQLLAARRSYREIAQTLFISLNTVKSHVSHVYTKLGANNRKDAVERALAMGLCTAPVPQSPPVVRTVDAWGAGANNRSVDFGRITLVAEALTAAVDAEEILEFVVMQGLGGLHADGAIMTFIVNGALVVAAAHGYSQASIAEFFPASLDQNLPLTVAAREREMVWVPNREEAAARFPSLVASPASRSEAWIAAPMVAEGRVFGAFGVSFYDPHYFEETERAYLRTLSDVSALALYRERESYLIPEGVLGEASLVMRLRTGAAWPRGGWLLRGVTREARRRLAGEGYEITDGDGGRVIVEPPES
jgi:DNA-binding CsgD family transcriptional regulator/GGDEF domain-containing protein